MSSQPTSELEQQLLERAARVHAASAELLETLTEFAATDEWHGYGIRSFGHWCDINVGLGSQRASRLADIAARLSELPRLRKAFAEGSVSVDKVLAVACVATAATDEKFTKIALLGSVTQVRRICGEYRKLIPGDPDQQEKREGRRGVTEHDTACGLIRIVAMLESDEAAVVLAALDARVEAQWREGRDPENDRPAPELSVRRADAMVELATEGLEVGPDPIIGGERVEVRAHIDSQLLAGVREDGLCCIEGIGAVSPNTIRRLLCDCKITSVREVMPGVFDLGRTQRTANRRQRRALTQRDGGCHFPGCPMRRFVQVHHAVPWEWDGPTDMANLMLLCPAHHRLFHEGQYTIDVLGGGEFTFRRPDGRAIAPPELRAKPCAGASPPGDPRAEGRGEAFDLGLTIDALLGETG
jgi:hypothetical protein